MIFNVMKRSWYVFNTLGIICYLLLAGMSAIVLDVIFLKILSIITFLSIIISMLYVRLYGKYKYKLSVDSDGVRFIKPAEIYNIRWDDMKFISISADIKGGINRNCMICFYNGEYIRHEIRDIKDYTKDYFGVQYRQEIIKEIQKYWDKRIWGLYQVEGKDNHKR